MTKLTHLDANGAAAMVDVSDKDITQRVAVAEGVVIMAPATLALIHSGNAKKGDVLGVARLAGIMGAKKTSDLIPLCHPIALTRVAVDFEVLTESAEVLCTATAQTGAAFQRKFIARHGRDLPALVRAYRDLQATGQPVHTWTI